MQKTIVFTDLDGTLLDYKTYSFDPALPALRALKERDIPLIICSSKTRAEIEYYRGKLDNKHPFVSENGGGIFIPKNYFALGKATNTYAIEEEEGYDMIRLGTRYSDLRNALKELRQEGFHVRGFGDMKTDELAAIAHMTADEAMMAQARDFDEPFIFEGDEDETKRLLSSIVEKGFMHTRGRFFHLLGDNDKGTAVSILMELYRKKWGDILTVALGDSPNDLPMLERADYPIVVQQPDSTYEPDIDVPRLIRANGIGPEGWNMAMCDFLQR